MRNFANYTAWALDPDTQKRRRLYQAGTQAGAGILALMPTPHHLLFARNPVRFAYDFGLAWPWLDPRDTADAGALRRFLQRERIRYVMWQSKGPSVRSDRQMQEQTADPIPLAAESARRALSFRHSLSELASTTTVMQDADGFIVLDLEQPRRP